MAKHKSKIEFKRVNINIPSDLIERVKAYGEKKGLNKTSAYIVLLNDALEKEETMSNIPSFMNMMNEMKMLQKFQNDNELEK